MTDPKSVQPSRPSAGQVVDECLRAAVHLSLQPSGRHLRIEVGDSDPAYRNKILGWLETQMKTYPTLRAELLAFLAANAARPLAQPRACACCGGVYYAEPATMCYDCRGPGKRPTIKPESKAMNEIKRASLPLRVVTKAKTRDADGRTFDGFASTADLDFGGDVVMPTAFDKTLAAWRSSGNPLPLIDQHQYDSIRNVIGQLVDGKSTDGGLLCSFEVIDTPDGDEAIARVRGGYVNGLSIGYMPVRTRTPTPEQSADGIVRIIDELDLHEVSLVIYPMCYQARVTTDATSKNAARARLYHETPPEQHELRNRISKLLAREKERSGAMGTFDETMLRIRLGRLLNR